MLASLVKSSKEDNTEIDVINVDFNSFVFDFLTRWFNIVFLNVMIMLNKQLLFVEHLCFLFKSLSISDFRLINVAVNIFNVIALSFLCFCTTWYKDLYFMTFFFFFFSDLLFMTLKIKDSVYILTCFTFSHVLNLFMKTMLQAMI